MEKEKIRKGGRDAELHNLVWLACLTSDKKAKVKGRTMFNIVSFWNIKDNAKFYRLDLSYLIDNNLLEIHTIELSRKNYHSFKREIIYYYSTFKGWFDLYATDNPQDKEILYPDKDKFIPFLENEKVREVFFNKEVLRKVAEQKETFNLLKKFGIRHALSYVFSGLMLLEIIKALKEKYGDIDKIISQKEQISNLKTIFAFNSSYSLLNIYAYIDYHLEHIKDLLEVEELVKQYGIDKTKLYEIQKTPLMNYLEFMF